MVYYLGYYSCEEIAAEKRIAAPPAMNKMGYIISVLSEITEEAAVVSPCETGLNRYVKGGMHILKNGVPLQTFGSFQSKNRLLRILGHGWTKAQLMLFLMTHVKSRDTLVVYHSLALMRTVKLVKKVKKCSLVLEVEELYSDVKENDALREKELKYLQLADRYIMITELLNKEVNLQNKPRIISHGTYRTVPNYGEKINDGKIHVVYAGSFNPVKGGACVALDAAEFLSADYVLHIMGKGKPADQQLILRKIEEVSGKTSCRIEFDGYKTGQEFDRFIQSCHVGLSTQQPDGKYNASSFPSKILMYMSNGLPVVSVRIPAVDTSEVKDYIYYYDTPTPKEIAHAIERASAAQSQDPSEELKELHEAFSKELSAFLET